MPRIGDIRRHRVLLLVALCFSFAAIACNGATAVPSATPAAHLFISPTGSDSGSCTQSSPCATFDRAYRAAAQGQTVDVLPGDYGPQAIKSDSSKTGSARVIFAAANVAQAHVSNIRVGGNHIEFRRLTTTWNVQPGTSDIIFRGVVSPGPISISGASHISIIGGEIYSPVRVSTDSQIASIRGLVPTDILIDGVSFHDFRDIGPGQLHHIECLQFGAGVNVTVRNSTFYNCATHDIFIRSRGTASDTPSPLSNVVIENNWFGPTDGFYAMQILDDLWTGSPATSVTVRNNSSLQTILIRVSHGTASVRGNILPSMSEFLCGSYGQRQWFAYNVYSSGVPCGPHDHVGDPRFVDASKLDLHLQAGSAALGRGDPSSHPVTDIDGNLRPMRLAPDAGGSQRESAEIDINKAIGFASLGASKAQLDAFYGGPRRTTRFRGRPGTTIATYRAHGGALWVLYRNKAAVGVGTTSRYYSTLSGLGVGMPTKQFAPLKLRWGACKGAYRRSAGLSGVYVTRGSTSKVTSIWVLRRGLGSCPRLPG
jgi:hypothetical protein